jgi:threonylcarbamoyladenosine tRNA methylthiotransferase MtaB
MSRQYRTDDFHAKVEMIKTRLDRPAITTDIIVGFPGETDSDFEKTVSLAEEVGFAKMHIFAFSPRKGTAAANMQDTVPKRITQERSRILRELDKNLQRQFRQQFINETAEILLESEADDPTGRSERYFMVCVKGGHKTLKKNDLVKAVLVDNTADGMVGELNIDKAED